MSNKYATKNIVKINLNELSTIPFIFKADGLCGVKHLTLNNKGIYTFDYGYDAYILIYKNNDIISEFKYSEIFTDLEVSPQEFIDFHLNRFIEHN